MMPRKLLVSLGAGTGVLALAALGLLIMAGAAPWPATSCAAPAGTQRADRPITTARGPAGDLLRKWWAEGTAAGNVGDWYDNRDRAHSQLDLKLFPQLSAVTYTQEELARRADWAAARTVRPQVTFGNSSTSAGVLQGGSNVRQYYTQRPGLQFLYTQYRQHNLYIYPEHRDHDPGHNGAGDGYGDLYPTNTPYLIASQGSSGSDQPFMRAVPMTLAAFRPEVKAKLVQAGLLMPTVQMILRATGKQLGDPKEYLTGKAHPTVFEGGNVQDAKMVQMAHEMGLETVPPLVQLRIVEEDAATPGVDHFDLGRTEVLANTPGCIARIVRATRYERRMVVSAEADPNPGGRAVTWHWAILRGDPAKITITRRNAEGSEVELRVAYPPRQPIAPGATLESNRVDIAAFAHNGTYYSAPAFVTFFSLDAESRTYDAGGRLLEIGYGAGTTTVSIANWAAALDLLAAERNTPPARLLQGLCPPAQLATLREVAGKHGPAAAADKAASAAAKAAAAAKAQAGAAVSKAEQARAAAQKAQQQKPDGANQAALERAEAELKAVLDQRRKVEAEEVTARVAAEASAKTLREALAPARAMLEPALAKLVSDPEFAGKHAGLIAAALEGAARPAKFEVTAARQRLHGLGLLKSAEGMAVELQPLRGGSAPLAERLTAYEKMQLTRYHGVLLKHLVLPNVVKVDWTPNYVDGRLASPKDWRDVYQYGPDGTLSGWVRWEGTGATAYDAQGKVVGKR